MIGRIPNVYEALYLQGLVKNQRDILFPNFIDRSEAAKEIRKAGFFGFKQATKYSVETTINNNPEEGMIYLAKTQEDVANLFKNEFKMNYLPKNIIKKQYAKEQRFIANKMKMDQNAITATLNNLNAVTIGNNKFFSFKKENTEYTISSLTNIKENKMAPINKKNDIFNL